MKSEFLCLVFKEPPSTACPTTYYLMSSSTSNTTCLHYFLNYDVPNPPLLSKSISLTDLNEPHLFYLSLLLFWATPCSMWEPSSLTRNQTHTPQQWKCRVLTTGLHGSPRPTFSMKTSMIILAMSIHRLNQRNAELCETFAFFSLFGELTIWFQFSLNYHLFKEKKPVSLCMLHSAL